MLAITSFKNNPKRSEDYNRAWLSWESAFDGYFLVKELEPGQVPEMGEHCLYSSVRPTIKTLAEFASGRNGWDWSCIINADIIVNPRIKEAENALNKLGANCAFSRRIPVDAFEPVDLGLDFFCAKPDVWKAVAQAIPEQFLIGKQQWDTWLMSFLAHEFRETFYDLSPSKLIYHPNHEDRGDQSIQIDPDKYLKNVMWAKKKLKV